MNPGEQAIGVVHELMAGDTGRRMIDARLVRAPAPKGVIPAKRSAERESSGAFDGRVLGWIPAVAALAGMTDFGGSKSLDARGWDGRRHGSPKVLTHDWYVPSRTTTPLSFPPSEALSGYPEAHSTVECWAGFPRSLPLAGMTVGSGSASGAGRCRRSQGAVP